MKVLGTKLGINAAFFVLGRADIRIPIPPPLFKRPAGENQRAFFVVF
jgi:hypothetical protein